MKAERTFAVTGVHHGSIVTAKSRKDAIRIFQKFYSGEKILLVKDISSYNLENL
jgi:hypothetical protein